MKINLSKLTKEKFERMGYFFFADDDGDDGGYYIKQYEPVRINQVIDLREAKLITLEHEIEKLKFALELPVGEWWRDELKNQLAELNKLREEMK